MRNIRRRAALVCIALTPTLSAVHLSRRLGTTMRSIVHQRSSLALLLIATLVAGALIWPAPRVAQANDGWIAAVRLTDDGQALYPDILADSQNVTHVVFTQTPDLDTGRNVRYINNRSGTWS